ncbi:MAG: ATP-binding protein [Hyphomicrobiaceae bacterium]
MKFNSLAFRLFATAAAWTLIALPVVGIIIYSLISNLILEGFDNRLRQHAWVLQSEAITGGSEPSRPKELPEPLFGVTNSGWYWRIKPYKGGPGRTFVSNSLATGSLPSPHEAESARTEGDMHWLDVKGPLGQPLRVVELIGTISEADDAPIYLFAVAGPLDWPGATINNFGLILALAFGLTGVALLAATLLQVKVALKPLAVIEHGLSDIRTGAAERLDGQFPAEIEPLQVELNALMESNEDIIERARTQVGNLAHALKTPLAVLTNEADQTKSPLSEKVSEQTSIMGDQISHYLDRARMAARANTIGRVTTVQPVVEGLKRALERIHLEKGVRIAVDCEDKLTFRGEKQDLEELLGNLLDNASKWSDGHVRLTGRFTEADRAHAGQQLRMTIEDDGPGVPEAQRDAMVKRGQRLDETKPGSGLGLSIVRDLVTSYRGELQLSRSELGGLKAELTLPAVKP